MTAPNLTLLLILIAISLRLSAQKLPDKQSVSVRAPVNIKIDGKADEWGDKFQAYNHATEIYYTMANDNNNLYLVIKAVNGNVIAARILAGGISFTVNHTLRKADTAAVTVTYPVLQGADKALVSSLFDSKRGMHVGVASDGTDLLTRLNNAFAWKSKYINVAGIKEFPDNEISVYNEQGIKAAATFNPQGNYVYELAIPLKYLALPGGAIQRFSYHIKLNMNKALERPVVVLFPNAEPPPRPDPIYVSSTDFWGEYTLAKIDQ